RRAAAGQTGQRPQHALQAYRDHKQPEQDTATQYPYDRGPPPLLCRNRELAMRVALGYRALDRLARTGLYEDAPVPNSDREHVHRPGRGPALDLAVAVVQGAVARAVEPPVRLDAVQAGAVVQPRHRTAQV